jgi:hypothetical protein
MYDMGSKSSVGPRVPITRVADVVQLILLSIEVPITHVYTLSTYTSQCFSNRKGVIRGDIKKTKITRGKMILRLV